VALADRTLAELLDQIAAREPAPGGGAAAAITGATAAALVEMAAAFALGRAGADDGLVGGWAQRGTELRAQLLALAEADTSSYRPVLEAMRKPRDSPGRAQAIREASSAAAGIPVAIAAACAEVAELGSAVARACSPHLVGDCTAAVVLAEGATSAAARLVELNLADAAGDPRLRWAADSSHRASTARARTLGDGAA
jgi:formiminotetrahydrofolate cyclodeaminase